MTSRYPRNHAERQFQNELIANVGASLASRTADMLNDLMDHLDLDLKEPAAHLTLVMNVPKKGELKLISVRADNGTLNPASNQISQQLKTWGLDRKLVDGFAAALHGIDPGFMYDETPSGDVGERYVPLDRLVDKLDDVKRAVIDLVEGVRAETP